MKRIILRRIFLLIPVIIGVSILIFVLMHMIPGDPARLLAGENATYEDIQNIREKYGLNEPLINQYFLFFKNVFTGSLISLKTEMNVFDEIIPRFLNTLQLSFFAIAFATLFGIPLGIIAAVNEGKIFDKIISGIYFFGVSMPVFWLGILLMLFFSVYLNVLPAGGKMGFESIILPSVSLGFIISGTVIKMTRTSMITVLKEEHIRTMKAYGVKKRKIVYKYALKNALAPIITILGLEFGYTLGGAILTEKVFGWPGLGRLIVDSIYYRDYPVVQVGIMVIAVSFVLVNLIVDILQIIINPRIAVGENV
ncbi:MAG: peptide/nickel transport system permease protein [Kosmotogales bacterium]|nr:peptide/nickel transport system permease protein [Kosmotogales bacterium]